MHAADVVIWGMLPGSCDEARTADCPAPTDFTGFFKEDIQQLLVVFRQTGATGAGTGAGVTGRAGELGNHRLLHNDIGNPAGTGTSVGTSAIMRLEQRPSGCSGSSNESK